MVEAVTFLGRVWAIDAISVHRAGAGFMHVTMKNFVSVFRQFDALQFGLTGLVEQA